MKYDTETVRPTSRFIEAIKELMRAEMELMILHEPENADCWTWGICEVGDLANIKGLAFEYGGEECKPKNFPEFTDCWVKGI
jgi:abortive infection bacteriophage resistance protein